MDDDGCFHEDVGSAHMLTRTTTALLEDLTDPANAEAWQAFDDRYRPVLMGFARRLGFAPADAAEIAQEALVRFVGAYRAGRYHRERGRLSTWLISIARNCAVDDYRARARRRETRGASAVADLPDESHLAAIWEREREREVLRAAIGTLSRASGFGDRTVRAFRLLAVHQLEPARVAEELGMTMNDVYLAKHRCLKRLRTIVEDEDAAWDDRPETQA